MQTHKTYTTPLEALQAALAAMDVPADGAEYVEGAHVCSLETYYRGCSIWACLFRRSRTMQVRAYPTEDGQISWASGFGRRAEASVHQWVVEIADSEEVAS